MSPKAHDTLVLEPHQHHFLDKVLTHDCFGVFLSQGGGKTTIMLEAIRQWQAWGQHHSILLLCPAFCIKNVWLEQMEKWGYAFSYHIAHGKGLTNIPPGRQIYFASVDSVNSDKMAHLLSIVKPHTLIVDESSYFRNHNSRRTKNLHKIVLYIKRKRNKIIELHHRVKRVYLLSGTPIPRHIENLWPQLFLLDGGARLGRTISDFHRTYCLPYNRDQRGFIPYPGANKRIYRAIGDIAETYQVPNTLGIRYQDIHIDFSPAEKKLYKKLERNSLVDMANGEKLTAFNISTKVNLLRQLSGGAYYDKDKTCQNFSNAKIEAVKHFLFAQQGRSVLIGYHYTHEGQRLYDALTGSGYTVGWIQGQTTNADTQRYISQWNERKLDALIGQPSCMGHGLNLQFGGSTILWFSAPRGGDFDLYDQFNARLYGRKGQKERVIVSHLVTNGSYDSRAFRLLRSKQEEAQTFIDYLLQYKLKKS